MKKEKSILLLSYMLICMGILFLAGSCNTGFEEKEALSAEEIMSESLKAYYNQWEELKNTPAFQMDQDSPKNVTQMRAIDPNASPQVNCTVFGYYAGQGYSGIDFSLITHLALAFLDAQADGSLTALPLSSYPAWYEAINLAHANGVKVVLVVRNASFDPDVLHSIVSYPAYRANLIANIINEIQLYSLNGVSIDFENTYVTDMNGITTFMQELNAALYQADPSYHISFATPAYDWESKLDYPNLQPECDAFLMMQYVYYGVWSATAGPQAPVQNSGLCILNSLQNEYFYWGISPQKLVLLLPYYGYQWYTTTDASIAGAPVSGLYNTPTINLNPFQNMIYNTTLDTRGQYYHYSTGIQGWCDNAGSIGKKCDLVGEYQLQGIGMWRLEYGNGYQDLWNEIALRFASSVTPTPAVTAVPTGIPTPAPTATPQTQVSSDIWFQPELPIPGQTFTAYTSATIGHVYVHMNFIKDGVVVKEGTWGGVSEENGVFTWWFNVSGGLPLGTYNVEFRAGSGPAGVDDQAILVAATILNIDTWGMMISPGNPVQYTPITASVTAQQGYIYIHLLFINGSATYYANLVDIIDSGTYFTWNFGVPGGLPAGTYTVEFRAGTWYPPQDDLTILVGRSWLTVSSATPVPTIAPTATPTTVPTSTPTPVVTVGPTYEPGAGDVWFVPQDRNVGLNTDFSIQVHANTGSERIGAYGIEILFNQDLLVCNTDIGTNGVVDDTGSFTLVVNANDPGRLFVTGFNATGVPGSTDTGLFTVHLTSGDVLGSTLLDCTVDTLANENGESIGVPNGIDGTITVVNALQGDVNGDDTVDITDALLTARYYAGLNPTNFDPGAADVNCDGNINIVDALLIIRYYVGIITSFPC